MKKIYEKYNIFAIIGEATIEFIREIGRIFLFIAEILSSLYRPPFYFKTVLKQVFDISYYSLAVVGLTAIFTGIVLSLQSYIGFARFGTINAVPSVVAISIVRELGPVLVGLMLAGKLGASISAEIATMKVNEQIEALYTLNVNPIDYLVTPRVIASLIALPLLTLIADIIGIFGGYIISIYKFGFTPYSYLKFTFDVINVEDVTSGLIKSCVFAFFITVVGCYKGYNVTGGSQGVGKATTDAVVVSSIIILFMDYVMTGLFFVQ